MEKELAVLSDYLLNIVVVCKKVNQKTGEVL